MGEGFALGVKLGQRDFYRCTAIRSQTRPAKCSKPYYFSGDASLSGSCR